MKDNMSATHSGVQVEIQGFAFGGAAFGKLSDGKICFVRGAVPGEIVEVEIFSDKKRFAEGRIIKICRESDQRITPVCPLAIQPGNFCNACPGCSYQQVSYETEIFWKHKEFTDFILRNNLADSDMIQPPFPAPQRYGWRNKLKLACEVGDGQMQMGYRGEDNQTLLPVHHCALARKSINQEMEKIWQKGIPANADKVHFRWTLPNGCKTWYGQIDQTAPWLQEQLGELGSFLVPPASFFQVNLAVAEELLKRTAKILNDLQINFLADLYCGTGIFSLAAAKLNPDLNCIGIELDSQAVAAARKNAANHNLTKRCRYYAGDSAKILSGVLHQRDLRQGAFLVDPPRTGLHADAVRQILRFKPGYILYVSCAPDTL